MLSKVMREVCADEKPDEKWLLMDGPVDTLWIESMNTVLADNERTLSLALARAPTLTLPLTLMLTLGARR